MMRRIAAQKGEVVDPHANKECTDWTALGLTLTHWLAGFRPENRLLRVLHAL
jgi:hypothetical protein